MMNIDLSFLLQPPEFNVRAMMKIEALAPLSMVTSMPGKYYRCQPEPTTEMLYGLLENALGWHISEQERAKLIKKLRQRHNQDARESGVGFVSLLQYHLRFVTSVIPPLMHYDDYWAQHLKGASFVGGSRNYDYRAIPAMNALRAERITANDTARASKDKAKIRDFYDGDVLHLNVLRPYFPQYYSSPTPRGYVVPKGAYQYIAETSEKLAKLIGEAVSHPVAPLYLGSNDGWVELELEVLQ
jgi:CRISPR-associated protein Cas5